MQREYSQLVTVYKRRKTGSVDHLKMVKNGQTVLRASLGDYCYDSE